MENLEIIEGNKAIHKYYTSSGQHPQIATRPYQMEMEYHSSYELIMPVWFKMQKWYAKEFGLLTSTIEISSIGIMIKAKSTGAFNYARSSDRGQVELNDIWIVLVEFCKWFNNQKRGL